MSIRVMTLVWDSFPGAGSELLAMLALADWCNDDGGSLYPSMQSVASKIRVSPSQARRILRKFEQEGYLAVVGNHSGGAPGMTRDYALNVARLVELDTARRKAEAEAKELAAQERNRATAGAHARGGAHATPRMDARDGLHGCARRLAPMRETASTHASLTVSEPSVEPSGNRQAPTDPENNQAQPQPAAPAPAAPRKTSPAKYAPGDSVAIAEYLGVPASIVDDYMRVRVAKRGGPLTATALEGLVDGAKAAGITVERAIRACCEYGWIGFRPEWYAERAGRPGRVRPVAGHAPSSESMDAAARAKRALFGDDHEA